MYSVIVATDDMEDILFIDLLSQKCKQEMGCKILSIEIIRCAVLMQFL